MKFGTDRHEHGARNRRLRAGRAACVGWLASMTSAVVVSADSAPGDDVVRAALPPGSIEHVMVIDLENQDYAYTFGKASPAKYLNTTLRAQGQLVVNYFATSHVSLGNYIAQVSGQGPTVAINNDCLDLASLGKPPIVGAFTDIVPGTDAPDTARHPGQVVGDGCVFPAPGMRADKPSHGAITIGDQLDRVYGKAEGGRLNWRAYLEDMGDDPARDYGTPLPDGGTRCAHPPVGGVDRSNRAAPHDQYATRHNPFVYFHSVIDDQARCDAHVVPLGKLTVGATGSADAFRGPLFEDLRAVDTTPRFMFVSPNLCNDGHDANCVGSTIEGTKDAQGRNAGGLVAADEWLEHWMPMVLASPAYQSGKLLVVLTFDESGLADARACAEEDQSLCKAPSGPNVANHGASEVLVKMKQQRPPDGDFAYPGGGQIGALLLNKRYIEAGSVNTRGHYNHYSALRSYEDLLGLTRGGDDGHGHLGYAAWPQHAPFGDDVFGKR